MLLAVDIGNTNIVLGFLENGKIVGTYRMTTKANHTSDEYGIMITQFLNLSGFSAVSYTHLTLPTTPYV